MIPRLRGRFFRTFPVRCRGERRGRGGEGGGERVREKRKKGGEIKLKQREGC